MELKDQVALITGAGRNIGKSMAKLFAAEGAKIVVAEMHEGRGQAVVDEITQSGGQAALVWAMFPSRGRAADGERSGW